MEDVKNIYIRKGERIMQLKELCKVDIVSQKEMGRLLPEKKSGNAGHYQAER